MKRLSTRYVGLAAVAMASVLTLAGCTTDGQGSMAEGSGTPTVAATSAPASESGGASAESSAAETSAGESSGAEPSSESSTTSTSASTSATSNVAAQAWDMTCSDYQKLAPDEKKEVTAELGRRLNKKELREGDNSWAIIATFCRDGLVRNSQGVTDSR